MRISSKGRYALATMLELATTNDDTYVANIIIAKNLGISKIYLEQILAALKRMGLVYSLKGAQGGYMLSKPASQISVGEILRGVELGLFEETETTVKTAPEIEAVMQEQVFQPIDKLMAGFLDQLTLEHLAESLQQRRLSGADMYYI